MAPVSGPAPERPRERLAARGPAALSDAELVAVLLDNGRAGLAAIDLSRALLERFGRLSGLMEASSSDVARVRGVGEAKAARVVAAREVARRVLAEQMQARDSLASPSAVRSFLRLRLQHLGHEVFWVVFLDAQNRVIAAEELFRGTLTQTSVYPREVVKRALAHNAAGVILAHNHPSGVAEPSIQDQALTRALAESLALVDVKVLDHFIVAPGAGLSFAERGLL